MQKDRRRGGRADFGELTHPSRNIKIKEINFDENRILPETGCSAAKDIRSDIPGMKAWL